MMAERPTAEAYRWRGGGNRASEALRRTGVEAAELSRHGSPARTGGPGWGRSTGLRRSLAAEASSISTCRASCSPGPGRQAPRRAARADLWLLSNTSRAAAPHGQWTPSLAAGFETHRVNLEGGDNTVFTAIARALKARWSQCSKSCTQQCGCKTDNDHPRPTRCSWPHEPRCCRDGFRPARRRGYHEDQTRIRSGSSLPSFRRADQPSTGPSRRVCEHTSS